MYIILPESAVHHVGVLPYLAVLGHLCYNVINKCVGSSGCDCDSLIALDINVRGSAVHIKGRRGITEK